MLRWCYILLITEFYSLQARSIIDEDCATKSPAVIPEHCIHKCVQLLYDNKLCAICENDAYVSVNSINNKESLVDKRKLTWCWACTSDQRQIISTNYELRRHIANFFNALDNSWCNDALHLNEYKDMNELHRTKRYNPGIGGNHVPNRPSYSTLNSTSSITVGLIIFGILLLCAIGIFCKVFAKSLDRQEYPVNS